MAEIRMVILQQKKFESSNEKPIIVGVLNLLSNVQKR